MQLPSGSKPGEVIAAMGPVANSQGILLAVILEP